MTPFGIKGLIILIVDHCQNSLIAKILIAECPIAQILIADRAIAKILIAKRAIAEMLIAKILIAKILIAEMTNCQNTDCQNTGEPFFPTDKSKTKSKMPWVRLKLTIPRL